MRKRYKAIQFIGITVFVALLGGMWFLRDVSAAAGQVYISPSASSVESGQTITVSLRINPGAAVDGAQATLAYDASKLQYESIDAGASAFPVQLQQSTTSGSISMARGILSGSVSSDSLIAAVSFKALTGSGSTALTLTAANATSSGTYTNPAASGATVNFTTPAAPAPTPPPSSGGAGSSGGSSGSGTTAKPGDSSPNSKGSASGSSSGSSSSNKSSSSSAGSNAGSSSSSSSQGTTPASMATPVNVVGQHAQFTQASISLQSAAPVQVYIKYGLNGALNLSTPVSDFATSHNIALDPNTLVPGAVYSYVVVVKDQRGNTTQTAVHTLQTKGFTLRVVVLDKNHQPLKNQSVTLHSTPMIVKTNGNGVATFSNVAPGAHHLSAQFGKQAFNQSLVVDNAIKVAGDVQSAAIQNVSVVYPAVRQGSLLEGMTIGLIGTAVIVTAAILIQRRRTMHSGVGPSDYPTAPEPVIVDSQVPHAQPIQAMPPTNETPAQPVVHINDIPYPSPNQPGSTIAPTRKEQE